MIDKETTERDPSVGQGRTDGRPAPQGESPSRPKRVAVFTGTRAEYGLLAPILRQLEQSDQVEMSLLVAGAHLSLLHGMTIDAIVDDGFTIHGRVEMLLASDSPTAITKSIGLAVIDLGIRFEQLQPDLLVVLGDRYEVLAAVTAAVVAGIPVAHIHGGEVTEGAFDDSIRHAVTKLSHLHFVATPEFGRRVAQLGEDPDRIHVVGAPAVDVINAMSPVSRADLERDLGLELVSPLLVLAYHPSTIPGEDALETTIEILAALDDLDAGSIVCSLPNADPNFAVIRQTLLEFAAERQNVCVVSSLGHERFLSLVRHADCIVGNSSSGLIEAPALHTPSVNVGQRQKGRPLARSVISSSTERREIRRACETALEPEFREQAATSSSPYDMGVSVASTIVQAIETTDLAGLLRKRFIDAGTASIKTDRP